LEFVILDEVKPIPWSGFNAVDKLILLGLPVIAIGFALLPFVDVVFLLRAARLTGLRSFIAWLINDYGSWIMVIGLLAIWGLFVWWKRRQLMNDKSLWSGTGCPNCTERELVRVSRNSGDRLYGLVGIHAYRYACRNCTWRGMRIGRREHSPELDAALEEALLRFDPDEPRLRTPPDSSSEQADVFVSNSIEYEDNQQTGAEHSISLSDDDLSPVDSLTTVELYSEEEEAEAEQPDEISDDKLDDVNENYLEWLRQRQLPRD
jgi:hypothetical protein